MWLGFLGELNPPPGDPPSGGSSPPFDEGRDEDGLRRSKSRYGRPRTGLSKYAWVISVVVHVVVLVGIYLGYRVYLNRPTPVASAPAPAQITVGPGMIVAGDDAASLVLGGGGSYLALGSASSLARSASAEEQSVPRLGWQSRPTFDALGRGVFAPGSMIGSPRDPIAAALPSSPLPRRAGVAGAQPRRPRP